MMSRTRIQTRTGAAAVEFAVAITVLLMIVFASIEFGRLNLLKHSVEHASYLAARRAVIVGASSSDAEQVAKDHLNDLNLTGATVVVSPGKLDDDTQMVDVQVTLPVSGNSWVSPVYFTGDISGRTRMYSERVAADMANAVGAASGP
ncbi:TadE/TadG family type IV pilus assembly protein [Stieleria varia]|uniref:TadE-like protein n=1 Tax=Stieleria varia TaxID=2528005 RepID=A0A5C5ZYM2_9BACT|nr:TadE family protein [Stieleria varia]TWT92101.1 TadE-like protein [Stieleria varia]